MSQGRTIRSSASSSETQAGHGLPERTVSEIRQCIKHHFPQLHWVKLYGSRAMGRHWRGSDIDLAFTVPSSVTADKVEKALRQSAGSLLVSLELFDVYRADAAAESRSLAFRLRLQSNDRTLTDADIAGVRDKCVAATAKLGAQLRS